MSGRLDAAMLAELRVRTMQPYFLVTIALSGGTKRYSDAAVNSATDGPYVSKVIEAGSMPWGCPDTRGYSLSPVETSGIVIADEDREFSNYLESSNAETLCSSPPVATIKIATANTAIPSSKWGTVFTGVLIQWRIPAPYKVELVFRTDTRKLDAPFGRLLAPGDWPYADPTARGQIAPMIWGTHDSGGEKGAVPAILADISRNRYLLAVGWLKSVDRVYIAGVQTIGTFTVTHPTINGRVYTCLDFTATPSGDVTADVTGYEATGDGTGALIENEADQLKHALINFVYEDALTTWLAGSSTPYDATTFSAAATLFTRNGFKGSKRIAGEQPRGIDFVNEWLASTLCRAYWTNLGKLAVKVEDIDVTTEYPTARIVANGGDANNFGMDPAAFSVDYDTLDVVSRVETRFQFNERLGDYSSSLMVQEYPLTLAPAAFDQPWSFAGQ